MRNSFGSGSGWYGKFLSDVEYSKVICLARRLLGYDTSKFGEAKTMSYVVFLVGCVALASNVIAPSQNLRTDAPRR